ncbi:MAG: ABC transporter permease [Candidatus Hydrogenedentes bacterium]|nr:ABC transporter permease [Candidatus Hydrogenedentota bacterium]
MRGFFLILKAEIVRSWIITRRYWFRTLTGIIVGYGMLMGLIIGFMSRGGADSQAVPGGPPPTAVTQQAPPGQAPPDGAVERDGKPASGPGIASGLVSDPNKATSYVLGFIIGLFAFGIVGLFTQGLQGMAQMGVLEQLCLSPYGLVTNFLARSVVGGVNSIVSSGIMLWLITWSLQGSLHWDWVAAPVLLALTFINLLGFGFMVGGLVLVFKQTGQLAIIVRLVLFGLALFADERLLHGNWLMTAFLHVLPVTDAAICLKYVFIEGGGRSVFLPEAPYCFYFLLLNCVFWTSVGIACFKIMENHSRHKGTLGAY